MKNDIELLINTCDKYHDVLPIFFNCFKEHWANCEYNINLNSEYKKYFVNGLNIRSHNLQTNEKNNWGYRFKKTISNIDSKYIITLFDDFVLESKVDQQMINSFFKIMENDNNIGVIYLNSILEENKNDSLHFLKEVDELYPFRINSTPALWRKSFLFNLIEEKDDPWSWEAFAGYKKIARKLKILSIFKDIKPAYDFNTSKGGAIYRGKWVEEVIMPKIDKYNILINLNLRGVFKKNDLIKRSFIFKLNFLISGYRMVGFKVIFFIFYMLKKKLKSIINFFN